MLATSPDVSASAREILLQVPSSGRVRADRSRRGAASSSWMPIEHLRFGLHFQSAQLLLESRDRARQLRQVEVDGVDLLVEPRAENAHFAGVVEHGVEQIGIDARHFHPLRRAGSRGRAARARCSLRDWIPNPRKSQRGRRAPRAPAVNRGAVRRRARRRGRRRRLRGLGRSQPARDAARCDGTVALRPAVRPSARGALARAQGADLREQRRRRRRQLTGAHQVAHAREFIETGLHDRMRMIVAGTAPPSI